MILKENLIQEKCLAIEQEDFGIVCWKKINKREITIGGANNVYAPYNQSE